MYEYGEPESEIPNFLKHTFVFFCLNIPAYMVVKEKNFQEEIELMATTAIEVRMVIMLLLLPTLRR